MTMGKDDDGAEGGGQGAAAADVAAIAASAGANTGAASYPENAAMPQSYFAPGEKPTKTDMVEMKSSPHYNTFCRYVCNTILSAEDNGGSPEFWKWLTASSGRVAMWSKRVDQVVIHKEWSREAKERAIAAAKHYGIGFTEL